MKRPQRDMTDRPEVEDGPGDPENGLTLLQVVPKGLHPLKRGRLLHRLRPVGDLLPGLDLLLGLLGSPLVELVQPLLAQGIDLLSGQVRQEVKSDRRTSITSMLGASAWSSIFGFSSACFSSAHFGHGPALRSARSTSASRRGLGTRIGNESRELEPGTETGAMSSESPLPAPWS